MESKEDFPVFVRLVVLVLQFCSYVTEINQCVFSSFVYTKASPKQSNFPNCNTFLLKSRLQEN